MLSGVLLSTAYLPPAEYFSHIMNAEKVFIEGEENYIKQTYRNRCRILSSNGILTLSVPVVKGPFPKTPVREIRIDYTKRWQLMHLRALTSSYGSSPYFQYYFDGLEQIIRKNSEYLFDLNMNLLVWAMKILGMEREVNITSAFEPDEKASYDHRYLISPKVSSGYTSGKYLQVFDAGSFVAGLSIIDLIFNNGPDARYLI